MSDRYQTARAARRAAVSVLVGAALGIVGTCSAVAQELNPNQESMSLAIVNPVDPLSSLCPQLARDQNTLTRIQHDLWDRCRRVVRAADFDEQANALQQITSEELSAPTTNAVDFNRSQRSNVAARLSAIRGVRIGGTLAYMESTEGLASDTTGGASGEALEGRLGIFVNGKIGKGDKDETSFEAGYDFDVDGLTVGLDYRFTDHIVAGLAVGYDSSDTDFDTGGSLETDNTAGSIFASWYGGNAYVDLIFTYSSLSIDSDRHVVYEITSSTTPGETESISHIAEGDTDGDSTAAGLSAGYNFGTGGWQIGPTAAVSYLKVNVDGFSESGGDHPELNLEYEDQEVKSLQLQLGLDVSYAASTSWGVLTPYARATYIWEQEDDQRAFFIRYVADPYSTAPDGGPTTASVTSDEPDDSYVLWGAGLSAAFANGFSAFIDYESVASLETVSYGEATVGLRYQFR